MVKKLSIIFTLGLTLSIGAQTTTIRNFKEDFSKLPNEKLSQTDFATRSPAMKFDSSGVKSGQFESYEAIMHENFKRITS